MPKAIDLGVDNVLDVLVNMFHLEGNVRGDEYDILCPNPGHNERSPSCGINLTTGYWNCFSCGIGGDLAELGKLVLGEPRKVVTDMMRPHTPEALLANVQRRIKAVALPHGGRRKGSLILPGPYEDGPLDEMYERDFSKETMLKWGVRFCPEQQLQGKEGLFTIRNSLAIPIRDESGHLLAWCYRATRNSPSWQPRYLYTPEVEISDLWFGLQHHAHALDISVVEGAADAMWMDQCDFPALALLGSKMGERKIKWLARYRSVTLFADRDSAGAQWVMRIGNTLGKQMPVYVVLYDKRIVRMYETPENKGKIDPQTLVPLDVELCMARRITWARFVLRRAG